MARLTPVSSKLPGYTGVEVVREEAEHWTPFTEKLFELVGVQGDVLLATGSAEADP